MWTHFLFLFLHIVILDHLQICFSMFYPPPVSCICFWSLTCVRQKPPNSKKGRRKYVMSSVHPPKTAIVLKEVHKECAPLEHVCMCASIVCLSVYLSVSLVSNPVRGSHSWTLTQPTSAHPFPHSSFSSLVNSDSCRTCKSSISIAQSVVTDQS